MILFLIIPDTPQIPLIELSCVYKDNEKKNLMFLILVIIERIQSNQLDMEYK